MARILSDRVGRWGGHVDFQAIGSHRLIVLGFAILAIVAGQLSKQKDIKPEASLSKQQSAVLADLLVKEAQNNGGAQNSPYNRLGLLADSSLPVNSFATTSQPSSARQLPVAYRVAVASTDGVRVKTVVSR